MSKSPNRRTRWAVAATALLSVTGLAHAQQAVIKTDPEFVEAAPLLKEFIHYTLLNRPDIAASYAQQLMDKKLPARRFVELVEASGELDRFENIVPRALQMPELERYAAALLKHFDDGKLERVRDPKEIAANIELLKGHAQQRMYGRERLSAAGGYSVPQLLEAMTQRADPVLASESSRLLADMGAHSVIPLCVALPDLDAVAQQTVADILGRIPYQTSLPFLMELAASTQSEPVRSACSRAIERISGGQTPAGDAASQFVVMADAYYNEDRAELTRFPAEPYQLLWSYNPGAGLLMTPVRTEVFREAMAMGLAERSLTLREEANDGAVVTWIQANFSRELDTPAEYENPAYPKTRRDAMYYAVAAGSGPSQAVLARALDDKDTMLARRAIAAVEQTAGGANLWQGTGNRRPLMEALRYPNRRVQYEAALALGVAQPSAPFDGSDRVVPILGSAIRDADDKFAVVIAGSEEYQELRSLLVGQGYTVLPRGGSLAEVAQAIAETPGIDVVVSQLTPEPTSALIAEARASRAMAATPILALVTPQGYIELGRQFRDDATVAIRPQGLGLEQIGAAVTDLVGSASGGPITAEEARDYSARCLAVLRDLAVSGNSVLPVADASASLISALRDASGGTRLSVGEVLSRINQKRAQVALMDSALNASGPERIELLGKVADSAKRFGNQLEPRQVDRVMELAARGTGDEATAAAALVGSLNLPNSNLVPLILGTAQ